MRRRATFVLGMALSIWSAVATGQVAPPAPASQEQARRDLAAGQRLLKKERFAPALIKLQASYAAEPSAAALLGMALAERETDRLAEAYRSYEKLLAERATELTPDESERAARALAELGAVTGTVKLTVSPPDAACALDDRPLDPDVLAHPMHLAGGRHVFGATKPGYAQLIFAVWITVGKVLETSLTLKPMAGMAPPLAAPPPVAAPLPPPAPAPIAAPPPAPVPVAPPPPSAPVPVAPPPPPAPVPVAPPPPLAPVPVAPPPPLAPVPVAPPPAPVSVATPPPVVAPPPAPVTPLPPAAPPLLVETHEAPPPADTSADAIRVGFLLGLLAFPRPLEGELVVKLGSSFALGFKGSFLPELSVPGVGAKLDLSAVEGIARWFPGNGLFFLGAGFGYQNFKASLGDLIDSNELIISADMSGFFVQPQLGFLWVTQSGFAVSLSFGVQIPIPKDPVVTATYQGQPVPAQATGTIPQDVVDEANLDKANVQSVARFIVKYPFPTLDLLRIGVFF